MNWGISLMGVVRLLRCGRRELLSEYHYQGLFFLFLSFHWVGCKYSYALFLHRFDSDLVQNSQEPIETLVKVGYSLGKVPKEAEKPGFFEKLFH
jgi:hypothetical protein